MSNLPNTSLARRISFRQLQVFELIARLGNFTRAAEELFLTQPTVSMQIRKLEESIDAPLFEHVGKKVFLTQIGKEFYKTAREILENIAHFDMHVSELQGLKKGHLKLAVVTTAKYYAPRVLGMFCQQYPGVDVSLKVTNRERLLERLTQNTDDLYLIGRPPQNTDIHCVPLIANPLVVIADSNSELCKIDRQLTFDDIKDQQFIIRETGSGTRQAIEDYFKKHDYPIRIRMELGSNEAIKHAVASGLGISILSHHTLSLGILSGPLRELDVEGFPITWPWYIGYPKGKRLSVVAQTFLDFILEDAKDCGDRPQYALHDYMLTKP